MWFWIRLGVKCAVLGLIFAFVVLFAYWFAFVSNWSWLPKYAGLLLYGLWLTLLLFVGSCVFGILLAIPLGLAQVTGPKWLASSARWFCTIIRGTPLLVQLWLLYFGLGAAFPEIARAWPEFREYFTWLIRLDGFWYALLAFSLSFAGYEGEVMRGAFLGVPRGELEAARAYGMSPAKVVNRIWFPRAVRMVLPTLAGESVLQLKAMPLASAVTVVELAGVATKVRQDTFIVFEPLILVAAIYIMITFLLVMAFGKLERAVPVRR